MSIHFHFVFLLLNSLSHVFSIQNIHFDIIYAKVIWEKGPHQTFFLQIIRTKISILNLEDKKQTHPKFKELKIFKPEVIYWQKVLLIK